MIHLRDRTGTVGHWNRGLTDSHTRAGSLSLALQANYAPAAEEVKTVEGELLGGRPTHFGRGCGQARQYACGGARRRRAQKRTEERGLKTEDGGRRTEEEEERPRSEDGGFTSGPGDGVPSSDGVVGFGRIWPCISGGGRMEDGRWRIEEPEKRTEDEGRWGRKRAYGLRLTARQPELLPRPDGPCACISLVSPSGDCPQAARRSCGCALPR
jgi:hypothetical protein